MPLTALGLLLLAASLHAIWNLLVKNARQKQVFTWWALVVGAVCFAPLLILTRAFPLQVWPLVICSALVEAAYYITLTRAYEHGDFSLVYPMARGTAPAFLVVWAIIFLGKRPRPAGFVGLALLVLGLVIVGGKTWWALRKTTKLSTSGIVLALGVACCISIYSAFMGWRWLREDLGLLRVVAASIIFVGILIIAIGGCPLTWLYISCNCDS